jgi:hypothetical protein
VAIKIVAIYEEHRIAEAVVGHILVEELYSSLVIELGIKPLRLLPLTRSAILSWRWLAVTLLSCS